MTKIDWSYHRPGCTTCGKTQAYLSEAGIEVTEEVNAKKTVLKRKQALDLARQASEIYVTKGKRTVHVDLKREAPDDATLASLLLGPTGNLRAPTLRKGKTLVVGFDESTYEQVFG